MIELEDVVVEGKETVEDLIDKMKASKKRAKNTAYERGGLQTGLQNFEHGHDLMGESINRAIGTIDRFRAGLKKDRKYMKRQTNEKCRKILNDPGSWMTKRVLGAQQNHFEASKVMIKQ